MPRQRVNDRRRKGRGPKGEEREGQGGGTHETSGRARDDSQANRPQPSRADARPPSRDLRRLLEGIGTPRPAPFKPDPFQLEALALLEYEDVLVTAPTGSGKTWIAREE